MVKIQVDLSKYHDDIIERIIRSGKHKTKAEVIRAAIDAYKTVIEDEM